MRSKHLQFIIGALLLGSTRVFAMGHEIVHNDKFDLTIGGRAQLIGYAENVADPVKDNNRLYLFLKEARLNMHGHVEEMKYNTEWAYAAEDVNGSNTSLTLLDFAFDLPVKPLGDATWVKVGQFKIPYSRERLAYSGNMQFTDRSLDNLGFNVGRDVGVALYNMHDKFAAAAGVFTGGSRDVPQRFLPEVLGIPLLVARIGYNDGLDKDLFSVEQNDLEINHLAKAAYINGFYMKDTRIGHDLVTDVKTSDKSILINKNWNPFLTQAPLERGDYYQAGGDVAMRGPLANGMSWSSEAEINYGEFKNRYGSIHISGARVQGGIYKKPFEFALRYAALVPDETFAQGSVQVTGKTVIHEITPAATYYIKGHDLKLVLDAPVLLHVPVFIENGVGAYVAPEQVDQVTVIKPATGSRNFQTVTEARLMFQAAF